MMSQGRERARDFDFAVARYKQGRCPGCGKKFGEPRGLEFRIKSSDLYCHTCRRCWPLELDIGTLRDEFPPLESPQPGAPVLSIPCLSIHEEESIRRSVMDRLSSLVQRFVLRH